MKISDLILDRLNIDQCISFYLQICSVKSKMPSNAIVR